MSTTTTIDTTTTKPVLAPVLVECILCQGAGEHTIEEICPSCNGGGEVQVIVGEDRYGYPVWGWETCPGCQGPGWQSTTRQCGHCEGQGFVEHLQEVAA
jgi:DnaJ-class molecular chaperone